VFRVEDLGVGCTEGSEGFFAFAAPVSEVRRKTKSMRIVPIFRAVPGAWTITPTMQDHHAHHASSVGSGCRE
jgi:hypothetical protein